VRKNLKKERGMKNSPAKYIFVRVDTHKEDHTACITNCWHEVLGTYKVANDLAFFGKFLDTGGLGRPLVQFFLRFKYKVKDINPVKVDYQKMILW